MLVCLRSIAAYGSLYKISILSAWTDVFTAVQPWRTLCPVRQIRSSELLEKTRYFPSRLRGSRQFVWGITHGRPYTGIHSAYHTHIERRAWSDISHDCDSIYKLGGAGLLRFSIDITIIVVFIVAVRPCRATGPGL